MIALTAGDEMPATRLAPLQVILPGQLQTRLHRFRTAGHEVHALEAPGTVHQEIRQRLGGLGGEERGVGVGNRIDLVLDRLYYVGVTVTQAGNRGTAGCVEVALAVLVDDVGPVAGNGAARMHFRVSIKDVIHVRLRGEMNIHRTLPLQKRGRGARPDFGPDGEVRQ